MIAMAAQWPDEQTAKSMLWQLRFSDAKLREIASANRVKLHQVDHLRRKCGVAKPKGAHRCRQCGAKIKTAECLRCHLEATHAG